MKALSGSVMTKEGETLWFGESDGYPQLYTTESWAKKFKEKPTLKELAKWDGMPWYHRLQPGVIRIYEIEEKVTREYSRKEVT